MSGTDEQPVPVQPAEPAAPPAVPPATPPAPPAAAPAVVVAPAAVKPRRGVGAAAFILGLLAILGDMIALVIGLIAVTAVPWFSIGFLK